jgi:hypothetical protein
MSETLFEVFKIGLALALFAVAFSSWPEGQETRATGAPVGGTEGQTWNRS